MVRSTTRCTVRLTASARAFRIGLAVAIATALSAPRAVRAAGECAAGLRSDCRSAGSSSLLIKNPAGTDTLIWKWLRGEATALSDLGDPASTTDYALCVYAGTGAVLIAAEVAANGALWSPSGSTGLKYKDGAGSSDGVQKVLLKAGASGRAKALLKGRGTNLPPPPPGPFALPVTAQLVNSANSVCFEGVYAAPDVVANQATLFKAKAAVACGDDVLGGSEACDGLADAACPGECLSNCRCRVPCGDSAPACSGGCPPGQSCGVSAPCECGPAIPTACGGSAPICNGACGAGETCASNPLGGNCGCIPIEAVPCANSLGSMCGGACPSGTSCQQVAGPYCVCL